MPSAVVTILFTDLVGSTELLGALGEDAAESLRREMFRMLRQAVAAHDGEEVKTIGDSLMVAFTSPAEAVGCAVDMQRGIDAHNRSERQPLAVRIGINAGEAAHEDGDFFGTPVVIAKRLCDAADGGQVLASDLVRALVGTRGGHTFKDLGSLPLKGIDDPVPACEIVWEPAAGALAMPAVIVARDQTPYVGRQLQRDSLDRAFTRAREGRRTLAMLAGEPGIGKTRTAFEFARAAHAAGAIVLYGRCDEEALLPYQPFVEALRFLVDNADPEVLAGQLGPTGGDLARLIPELTTRVPSVSQPISADPETERFRLFDAVGHLLTEVARVAPVVLVLDDLHWADAPTLTLLKHVLRWPVDSRLLIVGTYRDVELDRRHPLADVLADLRRDQRFERVVLHGLTRDEVEAMLRERARHELPHEAQRLVDALHAETEGNPFFIREIIRHLVESGSIYQDDEGRWTSKLSVEHVGLPEGVREVIGRRLARLSDECNDALRIASVIGRSFDLVVLEQASAREGSGLLDALQAAVDARVLAEEPGAIDRYTFTHALIRETLSSELTTSKRVRLHARIGEILERVAPDPPYAELAHHFHEAAAITGNEAKCVEYSRRAGEQAREMAAYEEAAGHYQRALEMFDEMGDEDEDARAHLSRSLGRARRDAGDLLGARAVYEQSFERASARGDADTMARAALGYAGLWTEVVAVNEVTLGMLSRSLEALPAGDSALRARLLGRLGIERIFSVEPAGAFDLLDEGLEMARRIGDRTTLSYTLLTRAHGLPVPIDHARSREICAEAMQVATEVGALESAQRGRALALLGHVTAGDLATYERERERFHATNEIIRLPFYRYVADLMELERSIRHGWRGDDERLIRVEQAVEDFARATGRLAWTTSRFYATLGTASAPDALRRFCEVWLPVGELYPPLAVFAADALELAGDTAGARRLYDAGVEQTLSLAPEHWLYATPSGPRLAAVFEDRERAALFYERFLPFAHLHICGGPTALVVYWGPAESLLGMLASSLAMHDEAVARLERGIDACDRMEAIPQRLSTHAELARALVRRDAPGDLERARRELETALADADRVGDAYYGDKLRAQRATL